MMDKFKAAWKAFRNFKPVRTAAQTALAVIATDAVGVTDVDWIGVASASALAAVVTVLFALGDGSSLSGDSGE